MKIPKYDVLTRMSTLVTKNKEKLAEEQDAIFRALFLDMSEDVIYHTFDNTFSEDECDEGSLSEYDYQIQSLALKDGVDLVAFSNGNVGFVSYCNGHKDAFEIIQKGAL